MCKTISDNVSIAYGKKYILGKTCIRKQSMRGSSPKVKGTCRH